MNHFELHEPRPYLVRVRVTSGGEDSIAVPQDYEVDAYSIYEAYLAAVMMAVGTLGGKERVTCERIGANHTVWEARQAEKFKKMAEDAAALLLPNRGKPS